MDCRQTQQMLSAYLDGELPPEQAEAVDAHVQGCDACARELAELKAVVADLHRLEPERAPADLAPSVMAAVGHAARRPLTRRVLRVAAPIAAAASIAVVALLSLPRGAHKSAQPRQLALKPAEQAREMAAPKAAPMAKGLALAARKSAKPKPARHSSAAEADEMADESARITPARRVITVLTNDAAKARADIAKMLAPCRLVSLARAKPAAAQALTYRLDGAQYAALLVKLAAAGYQLEPEERKAEVSGGAARVKDAHPVEGKLEARPAGFEVFIRFRPLPGPAKK